MRHLILLLVLGWTLAALAASPAHAEEWVEGDGYRFRAPAGFVALPTNSATRQGFHVKTPFGSIDDAQAFLFARETPGSPPSFLMAFSMRPEGATLDALGGKLDLDTLERMTGAKVPEMDGVVEYAAPQRTFIGGGQAALEFAVTYVHPLIGQRTMRCAVAVRDGQLITLYMDAVGGTDAEHPVWQEFVGSFRLLRPGVLQIALGYAPYGAGALALLGLILFARARGRSRRAAWRAPAAGPAPLSQGTRQTAGGMRSRAADGLPLYGDADGRDGEMPGADGPGGAPSAPYSRPSAPGPAPAPGARPSAAPYASPPRPASIPFQPTSQGPAPVALRERPLPAGSALDAPPMPTSAPPAARASAPAQAPGAASAVAPAPAPAGRMPTNVALRGVAGASTASPRHPEPAAPAPAPAPAPAEDLEAAVPGRGEARGQGPEVLPGLGPKLKIQRNSDFVR